MANRCATVAQIENQPGGNISAANFFDANWQKPTTALNESSLGYVNGIATDTGSANNYVLASAFGVATAYNPGFTVAFLPANTNTGSASVTLDLLTSQSILDWNGNPLLPGAIQAAQVTVMVYIGAAFRLIRPPSSQGLLTFSASPAVTSTVTVAAGGYSDISVSLNVSTAPNNAVTTLLFNNLVFGARVGIVWIPGAGGQALKISSSSTDQTGTNIAAATSYDSVSGNVNLITAGYTGIANYGILQGQVYNASGSATTLRFLAGFH